MRNSKTYRIFPFTVLGTALLVSMGVMGCTPLHNAALERARASYLQAQQDPDIVIYAPERLSEAEATLRQAERTWERTGDSQEVTHLSDLTEQKVEVARASAQEQRAESEIARLRAERARRLLYD